MLLALRGGGWGSNFQKKALRNTWMAPNPLQRKYIDYQYSFGFPWYLSKYLTLFIATPMMSAFKSLAKSCSNIWFVHKPKTNVIAVSSATVNYMNVHYQRCNIQTFVVTMLAVTIVTQMIRVATIVWLDIRIFDQKYVQIHMKYKSTWLIACIGEMGDFCR